MLRGSRRHRLVHIVRLGRVGALGRSLIATQLLPRRHIRLGGLNVVVLVVRNRFRQGFLVQQFVDGLMYMFSVAVASVSAVAVVATTAVIVRVVMIVTMMITLRGVLLDGRFFVLMWLLLLLLLFLLLLIVLQICDIRCLTQLDVCKHRCHLYCLLHAERFRRLDRPSIATYSEQFVIQAQFVGSVLTSGWFVGTLLNLTLQTSGAVTLLMADAAIRIAPCRRSFVFTLRFTHRTVALLIALATRQRTPIARFVQLGVDVISA